MSRLDAEAMELRLKAIERHVDESLDAVWGQLQHLGNRSATMGTVSRFALRVEDMEAQVSMLLKAQQPKPMRRGVVAPKPHTDSTQTPTCKCGLGHNWPGMDECMACFSAKTEGSVYTNHPQGEAPKPQAQPVVCAPSVSPQPGMELSDPESFASSVAPRLHTFRCLTCEVGVVAHLEIMEHGVKASPHCGNSGCSSLEPMHMVGLE